MAAAEWAMDNRVRSRMSGDTLLTHMRLEAWGRWSRDKLAPWPTRTVLGRMMDEGPGASHETTGGEIPEAVQQTDRAVAHLGEVDRRVIRVYYTEWAPLEVMARRLKMRPRQFQAVLNRARWRVSGYLAATL